MKIEIYNKRTGKTLETKDIDETKMRGFMTYFAMQADTKKYGWRYARIEATL